MIVPVTAREARVTETPNDQMTTLVSPSQGGSSDLSLWLVEMDDGAQGPPHVMSGEQAWSVLDGVLEVSVGDEEVTLSAGDSVALPAGAERRITARGRARAVVAGAATSVVQVAGEASDRGVPPWMA